MVDGKKLAKILQKEYGIKTMSELNRAIANMKRIDLTPFCGTVNKKTKEATV